MNYKLFVPALPLRRYIEKYYLIRTGNFLPSDEKRMFADGCIDMVINIGDGVPKINGTELAAGKAYISGYISSFVKLSYVSNCSFFGVQFKPGGFSHFVDAPITEYSEKIVEFDDRAFNFIIDDDMKLASRIDQFFISRLRERRSVSPIIECIIQHNGQISITEIANKFFVTNRTLERLFKNQVGLSPKEFSSLTRYRNVLGKMLNKGCLNESLLSLAYNAGYYDHAHLTREVKNYTGLNPSEIIKMEETKRLFLTEFLKRERV